MNIVFLDEYSLGGIDLSRIKQLGNYTGYEKTTPGEIAERCIDADIVITNKVPLRAEAIKVLPQLKLICIAATGMNNVDLEAAAERGIEVRNAVAMPLDELLRWSDIVSIHAPLNDRTRGLVGARELALMKPSALLINVARGGIVDEQALADALDNKRLAGAGIDVFSREPMSPDNPLLRVTDPDRLLLSPHTAWAPVEALETLVGCIERNIETFLAEQR